MYQKFINKFNSISFNIILAISLLIPFFFLPGTISGLVAVKGVILYVGVFLAFSFWLLAQFVEGSIKVPKNLVLVLLGSWSVLSLISALTSTNVGLSLWGRGFSIDSFATYITLALLAFLVAVFTREQKRLVKLFLAVFSGSVLTILLQVVLYATRNLSFVNKYFSQVSSQGTLVGSWVDFAYFLTFTFIVALLMYEVLVPKRFFKFLSVFAMILSVIVLIFLNFKAAWVVIVVSALIIFVYKSSVERSLLNKENELENQNSENVQFPIVSFITLLLGLFFFLSSSSIGVTLSNYAGVDFTDIRPSLNTSTHVMKSTLYRDPIFGIGAGRFSDAWAMYHPSEINSTIFWNRAFDSGFNSLESIATTNGLLPTIVLVAILLLSLVYGFKLFNYQFPDRFSRFIAVSSLVMLTAFVLLFLFSNPGIVLIIFGFIYIGLLIGVSTLVGRTKLISLEYLKDPRVSFFAILLVVVATMVSFSAVFFSGNRFASIVYYNRALAAEDINLAQSRLERALSLSENDIYWRTRATLFAGQFNKLANSKDSDKGQLQSYFTQAEQSARAAVAWDKGSSENWLTLSQVYQLVLDSKNEEAYTNAKQAADEAQKRSPVNPLFLLNQAKLLMFKTDINGALDNITKAINLKNNYLDAYIMRAQIKLSQGDSQAAINELTNYVNISPNDEKGHALLGQANFEVKNYQAALISFAQARNLNPNNPTNYLSYISTLIALDQKTQAIEELNKFKINFPNVSGVDEQINQLKSSPSQNQVETATKK